MLVKSTIAKFAQTTRIQVVNLTGSLL